MDELQTVIVYAAGALSGALIYAIAQLAAHLIDPSARRSGDDEDAAAADERLPADSWADPDEIRRALDEVTRAAESAVEIARGSVRQVLGFIPGESVVSDELAERRESLGRLAADGQQERDRLGDVGVSGPDARHGSGDAPGVDVDSSNVPLEVRGDGLGVVGIHEDVPSQVAGPAVESPDVPAKTLEGRSDVHSGDVREAAGRPSRPAATTDGALGGVRILDFRTEKPGTATQGGAS